MAEKNSSNVDALRTLSEVSELLDVQSNVVLFWESKFVQVKPLRRAGGRPYYRPSDVETLTRIKTFLHEEGLTIKGTQKVLNAEESNSPAQIDKDPLSNIATHGYVLDLNLPTLKLIGLEGTSQQTVAIELQSPNLTQELASARMHATGGEDRLLDVTVLIPPDQIKAMCIPSKARDASHARTLALQNLDGATPYDVDELVISVHWDSEGTNVYVAAVAKDTLKEAYSYCMQHKFAPSRFASRILGEDYPYPAVFDFDASPKPRTTPPGDEVTINDTDQEPDNVPAQSLDARVNVTQALKRQGEKVLRAEDGVLEFNPGGLIAAQDTQGDNIVGNKSMILVALRGQLAQLQSESIKRQLPEEIVSRLNSYAVPLSYETPALILLEGPMAFLKGGLNDSYTTDALDGGFVGGWQKLCDLHDQLADCLDTTEAENDSELRLAEDFDIEKAREVTQHVLDAVDSPSVSEELICVLQATRDTIEKLDQRPGLVRRALILIAAITAFAATGASIHTWAVSLEGAAVIERLKPLVERFATFFTI